MSEKHWRELPSGVWLYFKNLPVTTTDESLSAYLRERGLDIGPECISITVFDGEAYRNPTAGATVSVRNDVVLLMAQWVLNGDPIDGKVPRLELTRCSGRSHDRVPNTPR
jgi:hypothetical protein